MLMPADGTFGCAENGTSARPGGRLGKMLHRHCKQAEETLAGVLLQRMSLLLTQAAVGDAGVLQCTHSVYRHDSQRETYRMFGGISQD
jgi:hypothetical protein